jgi:small GTP-binding protein
MCVYKKWDTAGQEKFKSLIAAYYRGADGVIMVYDITDQRSFDSLVYWNHEIETFTSSNIVKFMVGNKSDLEFAREVDKNTAQVLSSSFFC